MGERPIASMRIWQLIGPESQNGQIRQCAARKLFLSNESGRGLSARRSTLKEEAESAVSDILGQSPCPPGAAQ